MGSNPIFSAIIQGYSSAGRAAVSKTACRGFKSFCPCQSTCPQALQKPHGLGLFRAYAHPDTVYQFPPYVAFAAVPSHPPSTGLHRRFPLQHPKRTRFRLFRAESGAFSHFLLFFRRKIFRIFFVHSADTAHKLNSLVIPHSLVVSFLTWYSSVS